MKQNTEKALLRFDAAIELANTLLHLTEVEGLNPSRLLEDINLLDTILDTVGYFQVVFIYKPGRFLLLSLSFANRVPD